jgi:hypothetical protein
MNEKQEPSEFKIKVNAGDLGDYQNEESKKDPSQEYYFGGSVLIPNTEVPQNTVKLIVLKKATEKYELKEEPIGVEINVHALNELKRFLNEEAVKKIEEGSGIEFIGFIPGPTEVVVMTPARIRLLLPELPERIG